MSAKKRLSKNAGAIRALAQANSAIRKSMIGNASKDFISCLVLCAQKIIKGQVNVSSHHLKKLRPFEHSLQRLIANRTETENKKRILQRGGFLGALIGPLVGVLPQLLAGLAKRRKR